MYIWLSSSVVWLDSQKLSRFVSGHSVCWRVGAEDARVRIRVSPEEDKFILPIWYHFPVAEHNGNVRQICTFMRHEGKKNELVG